MRNPEILARAQRIRYQADPAFPGPERFKGVVKVTLNDGTMYEEGEEFNRGSAENPMTCDEIAAKFGENASGVLDGVWRVGSWSGFAEAF